MIRLDLIGVPKHHEQQKSLIGDEKHENLEINTESTNQVTDKKNMVKLVLQNKQICILKSHKFASNTKNTVVKSPKT